MIPLRGLLIGRFQPFHRGHLGLVQEIRRVHPEQYLLLGIGSAQASYTIENPFTAGERFEMIDRALREAGVSDCVPVPITDIDRHALWVAHVASLVPPFETVYTNNPLTRTLFERSGYRVESPPLVDRSRFEGAQVRAALQNGRGWQELVPPAVARYLEELRGAERLQLLAEGHPRKAKELVR